MVPNEIVDEPKQRGSSPSGPRIDAAAAAIEVRLLDTTVQS